MRAGRDPGGFAIVGIGCRFPGGASSPDQFWRLLCDGVDAITEIPPERFPVDAFFHPDPDSPGRLYARWGGFVSPIDAFDADFFGIAPREARRIDPQHRLLLEVTWEALEDGGQVPERLAGTKVGVFVGISSHDYADIQVRPANRHLIDGHAFTAPAAFSAANRISRLLDVRGPSMAIDTACSSSLSAVHLACRSLAAGECELALVAGVNLILTPEPIISLCKGTLLSPDGRCKAFDARANGYVRGEGAGAIVLKPLRRALESGDPIHAVIRGTAANQDGRTPASGIPSAEGQEALLREALREAGLRPDAVQYIEAHGTGTAAGDPIEAAALGRTLAAGRPPDRPCLMGSVKTNIGHLEAGAGIAGLIKTTLALEHRQVPPNLHFSQPNPAIPFEELRLRVPTALEPWPDAPGPAVAGVNSFGFGGANAHAILEEAPGAPRPAPPPPHGAYLLPLSARSGPALRQLAERFAARIRGDRALSLRDLCHTAAVRRSHHEHRLALVATSREVLLEGLEAFLAGEERAGVAAGRAHRTRPPAVGFVFSGMGPQWWAMGRQLLAEEPVFRGRLEECDRLLLPLSGWSLLEELGRSEAESRLAHTDVAHVANMALQVALAALWCSWGIEPAAVMGHSSGEMAAACVAGVLALPDAIRLAYERGRLQDRLTGTGRMLAAAISPELAEELLAQQGDAVSLAAVNAPASVTFSGAAAPLERIAAELQRRDLFCRMLPVEVPYHGPSMETIRDELLEVLGDLHPRQASIPFASTVTAGWMDGPEADRGHWWRNLREPVRFAATVDLLGERGCDAFVEVGPHPVLSASVRECLVHRNRSGIVLPTLRRGEDERPTMLRSLAALYARGCRVEWSTLDQGGAHVALPTYPWQRERHWFDSAPEGEPGQRPPDGSESGHPLLGSRLRSPRASWESELGRPGLDYLEGHAVADGVVFPAAGYVELALAAGRELRGEGPLQLDGMEFHQMLALSPRQGTRLQAIHDPDRQTIEIHATAAADPPRWAHHATARLGDAGAAPGRVDLAAIRERCAVEMGAEDLYGALARRGLRYAGAFRAIRALRRGPGEALARIELPGGGDPAAGDYQVHPALLDASFQVVAAALGISSEDRDPGRALLPVSLARVAFMRRPAGSFWVHAVARVEDGGMVEGDVELLDDSGDVLVQCQGLRARPLGAATTRSGSRLDGRIYRFGWQETPLPVRAAAPELATLAGPDRIREAVATGLDGARWSADAYYGLVEPALDRLALALVGAACRRLGWNPAVDRIDDAAALERLGVAARHRALFRRLVELLATSPKRGQVVPETPAQLAAGVLALDPGYAAEVELLMLCGARLAEVLRGEVDAHELFFGEGLELLRRLYRDSPTSRFYNGLVVGALGAALAAAPESDRLRVLEVGAGTGGLADAVLDGLRARKLEYAFTDVSPFFVARARERYRDRPWLRPAVLDIEGDPGAQGFELGAFDVVLAANVLHGTADLGAALAHARRLLRPGGLLVLLEATRRPAWMEPIFGLLQGWWRGQAPHALLDEPRWRELLAGAGLEDPAAIADPPRPGGTVESVILARAPVSTGSAPAGLADARGQHWILLADEQGIAAAVAAALRDRGARCSLVHAARAGVPAAPDRLELAPADSTAMARLLAELTAAAGPCAGILHFWSLGGPPADGGSAEQLMEAQELGCGSALSLVQALGREAAPPRLWLVTSASQAVDGLDLPLNVAQAPLWGLGRVIMNEHPALHCRLVDLGPSVAPEEIAALVQELDAGDAEDEVAFRGGRRLARRVSRMAPADSAGRARLARSPDASAFALEVASPGALESILLREVPPEEPRPGQVAIRVLAGGLNFHDVLAALGMLPPEAEGSAAERRGASECAGIVLACGEGVGAFRPGDEVIAFASRRLGSHVVARSELVVPKPAGLSFEEAATIPAAFLTAHYGLDHLAHVASGERVLVHAASGGVGLAAIQICRRAGAEVFATAGTPEKRAYLRSIGVEHAMDSRSLAFADEVLRLTGGEGVDVVLNSLAGEAIRKGLSILRPYGRFVEIGKRDIYQDASLGLFPFRKNLSFFALDLLALCDERPALAGALLRHVVGQVGAGALRPLPRTCFDLGEAEAAYRHMAQARHVGKVVLTVGAPTYRVAPRDGPSIRSDGTYLVAGGLGGFGVAVASWLVDRGARSIVLMSRSGIPKEDGEALRALRDGPATVVVAVGDVAREEDVARVLAGIRQRMLPLRGVFHAAMVLEDGMLLGMRAEQLRAVLAPKVAGAWNLHRLTSGDDLDLFVLFSSIASAIGHPLQGNYAAANAFLDSLAPHRRALGLPALTVSWGALSGTGYLARHRDLGEHVGRLGLLAMAPAEALEALELLLRSDAAHAIVASLDWRDLANWNRTAAASAASLGPAALDDHAPARPRPEALLDRLRQAEPGQRLGLLEERVLRALGKVLGAAPDRLDAEKPLTDMGLDSLMSVELLTALKVEVPVQLGVVRLLQGISARELAATLLEQLAPAIGEPSPPSVPDAPAGTGPAPAGPPPAGRPAPAGSAAAEEWPLSGEQQRIWVEDRLAPGNPAYNLAASAQLSGRLDEPALRRALAEVLRRHEVLRARFDPGGGEPRQLIEPAVEAAFPLVDLGGVPPERREAEVQRLATEEIQRPFDLARGPLLRTTFIRVGADEHVVLLTAHHIVADAWGVAVIVREVMAIYDALAAGRPSPLPAPPRYLDYLRRRREIPEEVLERQVGYWRERLAGAPAELLLPADRPRPPAPTFRGGHVRFELSEGLSSALSELGRAEGATLFTTMLAAFDVLLHRHSAAEEVCVGTAVATRSSPGDEAHVGCCMNTLVLRTSLAGDPTFRELLRRVKDGTLRDLANQDAPFERVVQSQRAAGDPRRGPLFRVMLVFHNLRWPELRMAGLTVRPLEVESGMALGDLMLLLDPGTRLRGALEYSSDLFDAATAERMVEHLRTLLEGIVADPERRLSELPLVPEAERRWLLAAGTGPAVEGAEPALLHRLVEDRAARTPDAVAVVGEGKELTFAELDRGADRLAHRLRRLGVRADVRVGVCAPRSADAVVAALAVLKAGGAYLPIDPDHPPDRTAFILADAGAGVLLTTESLRGRLPPGDVPVVLLDRSEAWPADGALPAVSATPEDLAYVLYTSGTTGRPKGVMVPHRAICNQILWRQSAWPLGPADVVLQRTPLTFDPSIWELFGPLAAGARLVVPGPGDGDTAALARSIAEHGITTLQVVPSVLEALLDEPEGQRCRSLVRVLCGGEVLPPALRDRFLARLPWAELHNLYGPTETAIDATSWTCRRTDGSERIPIGRPIANARVYVLDPGLRPVPIGVPGELAIGGAGVARGYLGLPELTAQRFAVDPFALTPGARLYRSGDRARFRPDGALEYLGRLDEQVKIGGVRIEPSEIQAILTRCPGVREAAVVARDTGPGERRLVGYFVAEATRPPEAGELRAFLRRFLPQAMVPRSFVRLDRLPRMPSGKLDQASLPPPRRAGREATRSAVPPRDDLELRLAGIFEDLLDASPVSVTDDFFALGGHSLLAARLAARVRSTFGAEIALADLIESRTVEAIADRIRGRPGGATPLRLAALQGTGTRRPLFLVHALTGNALCYLELARRLGADRPVIGLQSPALELEGEPSGRLEDLAAEHVEALRARQAEGPYLLGGWSMGGVLAFEMAQQLAARGEEIGLLVLLDARARPAGIRQSMRRASLELLRRFMQDLGLAPDRIAPPGDAFWALAPEAQLAQILERARVADLVPPDAAGEELGRRLGLVASNVAALRGYVPRPYGGRVVLVRAAAAKGNGTRDPALGWSRLAAGGVELHTVPGTHDTMLKEPHVSGLAQRLRLLLDAAERPRAALTPMDAEVRE